MEKEPKALSESILFYDGVCNFCDGVVQFVLKYDHAHKFRFCALQSEKGQALLEAQGFGKPDLDTIVLLHQGRFYTMSSAVLMVLKILGGFFSLGYVFMLVPKIIRDACYRFFAQNRYKWFGKKDACRIPDPAQRAQFLDF